MTGTVALVPVTETGLTSRPVAIVFSGGSPGVTVDCISPATSTFTLPVNETAGTATPTGSVNSAGVVGPAGSAYSWSAAVAPGIPVAEVVAGVTFA